MSDPATPAEMRALADAKQREAQQHHARADDAGKRLLQLLTTESQPACPACGHVKTDTETSEQLSSLRTEQRIWAGRGNAAGVLAMFWRAQADRLEQAQQGRQTTSMSPPDTGRRRTHHQAAARERIR